MTERSVFLAALDIEDRPPFAFLRLVPLAARTAG
jgi:hypothetical protein